MKDFQPEPKICDLETLVDGTRDIHFVAIDDGRVVGRACLGFGNTDKQSPWLYQLFVAAEYRKRGIGTALVNACVCRAKLLGSDVIALSVVDESLITFYEQLGFVVSHRYSSGEVQMSTRIPKE